MKYLIILLVLIGCLLRIVPSAEFKGTGYDEALYIKYVKRLNKDGLVVYPQMVEEFIERHQTPVMCELPPTRFLYVYSGFMVGRIFSLEPKTALRTSSCIATCLSLLLVGLYLPKFLGTAGVYATAFYAFFPTQIHMAQHALIDGFFGAVAVFTLIMLWKAVNGSKLSAYWYGVGMFLAVICKENALFLYFGICCTLACYFYNNKVNKNIILATILAPIIGVAFLSLISGGLDNCITTYILVGKKAQTLKYAIMTGDGPFHRYLVDLILVAPAIVVLCILGMRNISNSFLKYSGLFLLSTYILMAFVPNGMNLRYASMWEFIICAFAGSFIFTLKPKYSAIVAGAVCFHSLYLYQKLCVEFPMYELVTEGLVRALNIIK